MQIYDSKLFDNPIDIIKAFDKISLKEAFSKIEKYRTKFFLLGYIRYEAKNIFIGRDYISKMPLLYFEVFDNCRKYIPKYSNKCLIPKVITQISKEKYLNDINRIKDYIKKGITYEVNYTYPSEIYTDLDDMNLYELLLKNQTTPYNAYIKNEYETLLSFSPELFFKLKDSKIYTKPMKGTIKRGNSPEEDRKNIEFLKNDIKNKSENIMIVDLLRNDLSRISKTGSVKVDKLFDVETHSTVHQMTSEISAELEEGVTLYNIFESIFPCGSITGAPKLSTMKVIDELEPYKRDIYCGAIGFISPEETVFSVPIRILQKQTGKDCYICHSGGAIVWDSDAGEEWNETELKRKFLFVMPDFKLIETMKSLKGKILYFNEHIERLKHSANELGFRFNPELLNISPRKDGIIRIMLSKTGEINIEYKDLKQSLTNSVRFAKEPVNSCNPFLYHKTDYRPWYKATMDAVKNNEIYDEIYFNEKGEITEGGRSNIIIEKNGRLYTPPIRSGLLNGIFRQSIIKRLEEKILYKHDVLSADRLYCINSVRGMVEVKLCL